MLYPISVIPKRLRRWFAFDRIFYGNSKSYSYVILKCFWDVKWCRID